MPARALLHQGGVANQEAGEEEGWAGGVRGGAEAGVIEEGVGGAGEGAGVEDDDDWCSSRSGTLVELFF